MSLSVIVQPGIQFIDGETPINATTLNALATPNVTVSGTVGGDTSVQVDGVTIDQGGAGSSLQVKNGAIGATKLADLCVQTNKIENVAVTTAKINDLAVTTAKLADAVITPGKLADGVITPNKVDWSGAAISGAAPTVDWTTGLTHSLTTSGTTTITHSGGLDGQSLILAVTYSGAHTLTWAVPGGTTLKWKDGAAPVSSGAGKVDVFCFLRIGTVYYATVVKNF